MRLDTINYLSCPACSAKLEQEVLERTETEVLQGFLKCLSCGRHFEIREGLADLNFPETLFQSDLEQQQRFDKFPKYDFRPRALVLGIWHFALAESRARKKVIDRLELRKNASVLETGVGTGSNLPIIAKMIGKNGQLDGMDISAETIKIARKRMKSKGVQVELVQANASYLPYETSMFDGVLHVGAFNEFGEKKRAIEEMIRVAKPGSKIVICDEGLPPGKEKTLWGKWILMFIPIFASKPPVQLVPDYVEELKLDWVWQKTFWVLDFRKPS
jgi:ubiquinone/menaquinone biosynthesis C-methylase UbiE/uncharacterized protein YbaR (Trm112 family)